MTSLILLTPHILRTTFNGISPHEQRQLTAAKTANTPQTQSKQHQ